jgi:hypothetical protein
LLIKISLARQCRREDNPGCRGDHRQPCAQLKLFLCLAQEAKKEFNERRHIKDSLSWRFAYNLYCYIMSNQ